MAKAGILITGLAGSGSTTLSRNIASALGFNGPYYAGGAIRWLMKMAAAEGPETVLKNITVERVVFAMKAGFNSLESAVAEKYKNFPLQFDLLVDKAQETLLASAENAVYEGRVVWHLAEKLRAAGAAADKKFVSICCVVDEIEGAKRQLRRPENADKNLQLVVEETRERLAAEKKRYRDLYGIDNHFDPRNFDFLIYTTHLTEQGTCAAALQAIRAKIPETKK